MTGQQHEYEKNRDPVELLKQQAEEALTKNEHDKAIDLYEQALKLEPDNPETLVALAKVCDLSGQTNKAETYYKNALALQPRNWRANNNLGALYIKTEKLQDALTYLKNALEVEPESFATLMNLGKACSSLGFYDEAETYYLKALETNQNNFFPQYSLGMIYFKQEKWAKVIELFCTLTNSAPDELHLTGLYSYLYRSLYQLDSSVYEDFLSKIDTAVTLLPSCYSALVRAGNIFSDEKEYEKALPVYQKAKQLKEDGFYAGYHIGRDWMVQGESLKALEVLTHLFNYEIPTSELVNFYQTLAEAYTHHNQPEYAIAYYQRILEIEPEASNWYWEIARLYTERDSRTLALPFYEKFLELEPLHSQSRWETLVWCSFMVGDLEGNYNRAIQKAEKALGFFPDSAYINFHLARMLYEQSEFEKAMGFINKAIALNGSDVEYHTYAGFILEKIGGINPAISEFTLTLKLLENGTPLGFQEDLLKIATVLKDNNQIELATKFTEQAMKIKD